MQDVRERMEELMELLDKKDAAPKERRNKGLYTFLAVIGALAVFIAIAVALYKFFAPD